MSALNIQILLATVFGLMFAGVVFLGLRRRRTTTAYYRSAFAARDTLSPVELARAFSADGPDQQDVLAMLEGAAEYLDVPPGKLRPADEFAKELTAPGFSAAVTARAMGTLAYKKLRAKYPGLKDSPAEMRNLADFVAAIRRDVEQARQLH